MLITRRSPRRTGGAFRARLEAGGGEFSARQERRCREELAGAGLHAGVLAALVLALLVFGHRLWLLFQRHSDIRPGVRQAVLLGLAAAVVLGLWRLVLKMRQIKDLRQELANARAERHAADHPPDSS